MLFGFYFLLVFVGVSIPAGIYGNQSKAFAFVTELYPVSSAKVQYNTSLSNVDWLHGGAEFFLTLTNLFIGTSITSPSVFLFLCSFGTQGSNQRSSQSEDPGFKPR